ncbi:MAG: histidine phosphatase family protein, partial [Pseudomonas sp.]
CIDHFARQQHVAGGERQSNYASALFITLGSDGKAKLLGQMAASEWRTLVAAKEL